MERIQRYFRNDQVRLSRESFYCLITCTESLLARFASSSQQMYIYLGKVMHGNRWLCYSLLEIGAIISKIQIVSYPSRPLRRASKCSYQFQESKREKERKKRVRVLIYGKLLTLNLKGRKSNRKRSERKTLLFLKAVFSSALQSVRTTQEWPS